MENSSDPCRAGLGHYCASILLGVTRVHDHWLPFISSEGELRPECGELRPTRRVVIVVVEAALSHRYGARSEVLPQLRDVVSGVEPGCIVRMDSRGGENEAGIVGTQPRRRLRGGERLTDTDDRLRARRAGARDYGVAVAGERRVREVGVAVDEDVRAPVLRGHFRSIQRRIGAAT